ncbi:DNA-3-methyladenine glycosylase [Synechococcus sp. PCC 7502]|uniref:DNA-3-methyladenine glycosylase n=1 Tax=Synechococcus sp. PCC 7502 TaxID=1173263 RepID=UPI00029FAE1E|nr:DNA-3-methyladenine glycosylase [Synechococcus sp. PCC 7502]AFY74407.1 DNA-3-methyladenine glycosylase [Synechococcus sp. PCC 7502]
MLDPVVSLFLNRPAPEVAPELLGCYLVREIDGVKYRGMIVETEAYAPGDPACHAYGKKSDRNAAMFGKAGFIYVYLIYGIYHCINIVTDQEDVASAVLIRALALDQVPPWIQGKQGKKNHKIQRLASGPGKLCRALKIDRSLNNMPLSLRSGLWLELQTNQFQIVQTTRIGLTKGTEIPWRWYIGDHPEVSVQAKDANIANKSKA